MNKTPAPSSRILSIVSQHRKEMRRYGVRRLGLFGSAARGDARKDSDLDFVVEFERKTFDDYMGLKLYLEELLHKKVDLVIKEDIKASLRSTILGEARYAEGL